MIKPGNDFLRGPARLGTLAALLAFGSTGLALALTGVGVPFLLAAALGSGLVGVVLYFVLRHQPPPDPSAELALQAKLDEYRAATAAMRHDLRGVMSPALMMSDRLLNHPDPVVQRVGQAVVRSIERSTALLTTNKEILSGSADPNP